MMPEVLAVDPTLVSVDDALLLDQQIKHDLGVHRPLDDVLLVVALPGMTLHAFVPVAAAFPKDPGDEGLRNLALYLAID